MASTVIFDPALDVNLIIALAVATALLIAFAIWKGLPGWWLRALAALGVLAALVNPSLRDEDRQSLPDIVFLVSDETSSQSVSDRPSQSADATARMAQALDALPDVETRRVTLRDGDPREDLGTRLTTALARAVAEEPSDRIAGAIVVTDGQVHDVDVPLSMPGPVHVLLSGHKSDWDRRIVIESAPPFAIVGEEVSLTLRIDDQGAVPGDVGNTTPIFVSVDGAERREFTLPVGRSITVPVTLDHAGANVLQFELPVIGSELTDRNNMAVVHMNGVRDRLRVLLVSGEPHAGERTWRNLLKSDGAVDLVHFTILRPPDKQDGVPVTELSLIAFPTRELFLDKIDEFDLIIFDRYRRRGILPAAYLENVVRYVEDGGAVLVAAGPAYASAESLYRSPLAQILPASPTARVIEDGFVPRISPIGNRHPVTRGLTSFAPNPPRADGLPGWGRWWRQIEVRQTSGTDVMNGGADRPLLVLDRVGQGRVALLASDQAWLWDRGYEGGGPQLELLRRLAHWMMKEPDLEEEALSGSAIGSELTVTRRSIMDGPHMAQVTAPDGTKTQLTLSEHEPGIFSATLQSGQLGLYRLQSGDMTSVVAMGPSAPREFEQTVASDIPLGPMVAATRGSFTRIEDGLPGLRRVREGRVTAGRGWIGLPRREAFATLDIRLIPLVMPFLFLIVVAAMSILGWMREGR